MTTWFWRDNASRSAAEQMAIDVATTHEAHDTGSEIIRIYRWREHTVSLGAHESATRRWDRERLTNDEIAVVRRPTGGRAVWHDARDLTYSWAGTIASPADVPRRYRELHQQLAFAIGKLVPGITVADVGERPHLGPGACFDLAAGGEVLLGDRKVIGSAQRVFGTRLLQHGAIAVEDRRSLLIRYALDDSGDSTHPDPAESVLPEAEALAEAIAAQWLGHGAVPIPDAIVSRIVLASKDEVSLFGDPEWTWRR